MYNFRVEHKSTSRETSLIGFRGIKGVVRHRYYIVLDILNALLRCVIKSCAYNKDVNNAEHDA